MSCKYRKNLHEQVDEPSKDFQEHLKDCDECAKDYQLISLLKQSLLDEVERTGEPGPGCYDEDTLAAYLNDKVSEAKEEEILSHLAACSACRKQIYQIQSLDQEVATVPIADIPRAKPNFLKWLAGEPVPPQMAYVPIAAAILVLVALVAVIGVIAPPGYNADAMRVALEEGRGRYAQPLSPEQYSFKQYDAGSGALALVHDASGQAANRVAAAFLAEALKDLLKSSGFGEGESNEIASDGLKLLAKKLDAVHGLEPVAERSRDLGVQFAGQLATANDLRALLSDMDRSLRSSPEQGYLADLGAWVYQVRRVSQVQKDPAGLLDLQDVMQNGAKRFLKKPAPSFYEELRSFLGEMKNASESRSPARAVKEACDGFLAKLL